MRRSAPTSSSYIVMAYIFLALYSYGLYNAALLPHRAHCLELGMRELPLLLRLAARRTAHCVLPLFRTTFRRMPTVNAEG